MLLCTVQLATGWLSNQKHTSVKTCIGARVMSALSTKERREAQRRRRRRQNNREGGEKTKNKAPAFAATQGANSLGSAAKAAADTGAYLHAHAAAAFIHVVVDVDVVRLNQLAPTATITGDESPSLPCAMLSSC